ncbi:MAG: hypothetical protein JW891_13985 [Candidatus Lokiarchaeota archaeon]|nr:hypothetical protein [Candidatus Lokiarchaeota archaeon]
MVLVLEAFILGITSVMIFIAGVSIGLFTIAKGAKYRTKLLVVAGFVTLTMGSYWLGPAVEFFAVIIFGVHLTPPEWYIFLSYTQIPFGIIFMGILAGELVLPTYKDGVLGSLTALGFVYWACIFSTLFVTMSNGVTNVLIFFTEYSPVPGYLPGYVYFVPGDLNHIIDGYPTWYSPALFIAVFMDFVVLILLGGGCLIKAYQSSGLLRRKFVYLAIGFVVFFIAGISDIVIDTTLVEWGIYWIAIARMIMCTQGIWIYLGLRT